MALLTLIQLNNCKLSNYKTYCSDDKNFNNYKHNRNVVLSTTTLQRSYYAYNYYNFFIITIISFIIT